MNFVPLVLVFVIFYFLLIAPQRRKQKLHAKMLAELKSGDRVVTAGGLYGTVVGVTDTIVQLRIADQVKVEVTRHSIAELRTTSCHRQDTVDPISTHGPEHLVKTRGDRVKPDDPRSTRRHLIELTDGNAGHGRCLLRPK